VYGIGADDAVYVSIGNASGWTDWEKISVGRDARYMLASAGDGVNDRTRVVVLGTDGLVRWASYMGEGPLELSELG
jgi:hypothetical protein